MSTLAGSLCASFEGSKGRRCWGECCGRVPTSLKGLKSGGLEEDVPAKCIISLDLWWVSRVLKLQCSSNGWMLEHAGAIYFGFSWFFHQRMVP